MALARSPGMDSRLGILHRTWHILDVLFVEWEVEVEKNIVSGEW